jgi:DNA polymerase
VHIHAGGKILAHNAAFDRLVFREILGPRHGWPIPEIAQWRCSMAMSLALALPGSLDGAGKAMSLKHLKDQAGKRVMLQMAKPRKARKDEDPDGIYWHEDAAQTERRDSYCKDDVNSMRDLFYSFWPLSDEEQRVWEMDQRINDRGFHTDAKLLNAMRKTILAAGVDINSQIKKATGGAVETVDKVERLKTWLRDVCGLPVKTLDKTAIPLLIANPKTPKLAKEVLELRAAGAQAAVKKVDAFLERRSADGRVRGAFVYHSAGTGRWSSRGAQVHNLKRMTEESPAAIEATVSDLLTGDYKLLKTKYARPLQVIGNNIRTVICAAPGNVLVGADFSGIEARITAWLAGEERKLKVFRDYDAGIGPDPYVVAAAGIYGIPAAGIVKAQRQVGKGAELAFGFQGGVNAYKKFVADGAFTDEEIDGFKVRWRKLHPNIVAFWGALKYASDKIAKQAVQVKRGVERTIEPIPVRNIWFEYNNGFMFVVLPSGRRISYPEIDRAHRPREFYYIEKSADRDSSIGQLSACFMDNSSGRWHRVFLYGGMCLENLVQGIARDLLAEAMLRVEKAGLPIVGHVHDECLCEVPAKHAAKVAQQFTKLMTELPSWARDTGYDLPLVAKRFVAKRYVK